MAAIMGGLASKPGRTWQWAEKGLIGLGFAGLFLLAVILYIGLAF